MLTLPLKNRCSALAAAALAFALVPSLSWAQIQGDDGNEQRGIFEQGDPARAAVTFKTDSHDIGTVLQTDRPEFEFEFTNSGASELEIVKIQPSCGCTYTELVKRKYAPGESGSIHVKYDPTNKVGPQNKHITVTTNDPKRPEVTLKLTANVEPAVLVEPRVVNFGSVNKDEERKVKIEVTGRTEDFDATFATVQRTEILDIKKLDDKPVEVEVGGKKMRRIAFELTLKPGGGVGRLVDLLSIRTTDAREPIINCQVAGQILPDVRSEPMVVAFGAVQSGTDFKGEARLTHRLGKDFKVTKVEVNPNPGNVEVIPEASGVGSYVLRCTGKAPDGRIAAPLTGKILVYTDITGEATVEIPYALQLRLRPVKPQPAVPTATPAATPAGK